MDACHKPQGPGHNITNSKEQSRKEKKADSKNVKVSIYQMPHRKYNGRNDNNKLGQRRKHVNKITAEVK